MEFLHSYHDGSRLYRMSARALCRIPIWKGNRIIDMDHVHRLKASVGENHLMLDSGYKVIRYEEEEEKGERVKKSYVVDGQHRIRVLQDAFSEADPDIDFIITVTEIELTSEEEAIRYFNQINHAKPISYTEDDNMIANRYLEGVLKGYDSKLRLIRQGATRRPYLSADRFREHLVKNITLIKLYSVEVFVRICRAANEQLLDVVRMRTEQEGPDGIMAKKMVELGFALALDDKFKWLPTMLRVGA